MDPRYKKLGKNTILVFIGKAGSSLISLLMLPLYTMWLSTEEYGTADLLSTYSTILLSVITCCIADSIFIFPKTVDDEGKKRYFSSGILFVLLVGILCTFVNLFLKDIYGNNANSYINSWFTLFLTLSKFLQNYTQQFTRCIEKMGVFSTTGIVYTACVAGFAFLLIPKYGLNGYLMSWIFANLVGALFSFVFSKSYKYFSFRALDKKFLLTLLKYGIPLIPNSAMWWMVNGFNRPVIDKYVGLSALGLYAVASKFPGIVSMMVSVFTTAWDISLLDEFGRPGFNTFFRRIFKLISFFAVFLSFFIIVFSKQIILFFSNESYLEAWHILPILLIGTILNTSCSMVGGVFSAMKQSKYFLYSSIASAITSVLMTLVLVKCFGLMGSAIAVALSFLVGLLLRFKMAWKHIEGDYSYYIVSILLLIATTILAETKIIITIRLLLYALLLVSILFMYKSVINDIKSLKRK